LLFLLCLLLPLLFLQNVCWYLLSFLVDKTTLNLFLRVV
jgi:hypothetical protein